MNKILISQGGGPTAVINQTLVGLVETAQKQGIKAIWGARHGIRGIVDEQFYDMTRLSGERQGAIGTQVGAFLGSTRDKPDEAYCQRIAAVCKKHGIDGIFYIGGNDSAHTVALLADYAEAEGHALRCFHVPKTIDNDLVGSDHTPGYPSAARFVAYTFRGLDMDQRALPGVHVAVVMGRHAGFLTAAAACGRFDNQDGPHIVCLPEEPFHKDRFLARVEGCYQHYGRCLIACAEGITDNKGTPMAEALAGDTIEHDKHGNVQLSGSGALGDYMARTIKASLSIQRVRADTLGYMQRSFPLCVAPLDAKEARDVGAYAIQQAFEHKQGSVAIKSGSVYALEELAQVGGQTRTMGESDIKAGALMPSDTFIAWARALIGGDMQPPLYPT
ncbi:MAG: diphosphate--fructose-6-phosphate 1-phosphotransferase [Alphaproteobacteria bacterium GM202ARS2]|nr:diphosphate--fructose-6-phosphate 1-phosphotransferase [Alphaproteobacteria bacterium GM202ARS2]